ncbi:MAG: hypothetical protein ACRERU_06195, partial [Methylococcales bacterium]
AKLRHDFRTPINHSIGYSELLLEEAENSALQPFAGNLGKIHTAGKTLLGMIDILISPKATQIGTVPGGDAQGHNAPLELDPNTLTRIASEVQPQAGDLLIVDDNETNRDMLVRRLQHQGYRVSAAADGLQALAFIERRRVPGIEFKHFYIGIR